MTQDNVIKLIQPAEFSDPLTEVLREGARALLAQAVEAEGTAFLSGHANKQTECGRQRLVRHGHRPEREIMTGLGPVPVRAPAFRDRMALHRTRACADGALGFWQALEEIWPKTRGQRCWVHKTANILNKLAKSLQPKAKRALQDI